MKLFLALAAAALAGIWGCAPRAPTTAPRATTSAASPAFPAVRFTEITTEAGLRFVHHNGMAGQKLLPETMGSGVAFLDYDGDGDPDLFLVNSCPWPGSGGEIATQGLYRNDGGGRFTDVTREVGLDRSVFGMGVAVGDYDNDGDPDLYVTAVGGGHLFRNDKGQFVDVTQSAGAHASDGWLTSAAFFDMENDGDLDLFVCSYVAWSPEFDKAQSFHLAGGGRAYGPPNAFKGAFCVLLRNDGGTFVDVSEASGIRIRKAGSKDPMAKSLGVAPQDVDGDGLVDVAVANDTVPNFLFRNLGGGKFEEIAITSGVAFDKAGSPRGAMGADWGDFRNDGSLGLAVANFANEMIALYVTDSPRDFEFFDMAPEFGLGTPSQPPLKFGLFFFDFDLDGRLDLLSSNGHLENDIARVQPGETYEQSAQLYWNTGRPARDMFVPVDASVAGPDLFRPIVGRGSAYADIDGDGDLDVVLASNGGPARLFRNDGGNAHRWIRLSLRGNGSNRDGIGARIVVKAGGVTQRRQVFAARGYLSSVELTQTFGLGTAEAADSVEVAWPSGVSTTLGGLKAGKTYVIDEKTGVQSVRGE